MNDCPDGEMRDLLPDLLNERLDAGQRALVDAHVAGCAECRAELALLGQLRGALRRAPVVNVASIVSALPTRQAPARRSWGGWRAAAAIATITVGGASLAIARHDAARPVTAVAAVSHDSSASSTTTTTTGVPTVTAAPVTPTQRVAEVPARELSVTGAVSDLSDRELKALLEGIESLDALPAPTADVESPSLAPATSAETTRGAS